MEITVAQVDDLRLKLREMPPQEEAKRKLTLQQAVARMANELADLQRRGYSIDDIANILRATGVEISPKSLKTYLSRFRNTPKPRRKRPSTPTSHNAQGRARPLTSTRAETQAGGLTSLAEPLGPVMPGTAPAEEHQECPRVIATPSSHVRSTSSPVDSAENGEGGSACDTRLAPGVDHGVDQQVDGEVDRRVDSGVDCPKDGPINQNVDLDRPAQGNGLGGVPRDRAGEARKDRTGGSGIDSTRNQPQPVARSSSFVPRTDFPNI